MRFLGLKRTSLELLSILGLASLFVFVALPPAQAADCQTDALSLLQQNDGLVGMYLKRVGGPVLGGFNESTIFEPASALKVLIHAHALRQVQDGALTLSSMIPWTRDLNEDVCGSHPCNVGNPQAESDTLGLLLNQMMLCSDNRHTHALRTFFTDAVLLQTAADLGLTDTDFNHIIGCPDCNSLNDVTLVDLGRIYEGVATGYLDEEHQTLFHDLMLNETNSGFIGTVNSIVDQEVAAAGKDPQVATDFKALIRYATKGGSYTLFNCNADPADSLWASVAGIIELPINNGNGSCEYVYGAWMNLVPLVVQGTGTVAGELLRLAVCEALQTWDMIAINEITDPYDPPNPWAQEGVMISFVELVAGTDLHNLRFLADPLQCVNAPCEVNHPKKIHHDMVEFVPPYVAYVPADETVIIEIKRTIPIGQAACFYEGKVHAIADVEDFCVPTISEEIALSFDVLPSPDMDIDDNHGNLSDNVMQLKGSKNNPAMGVFTIVNPNSWDQNVDFPDGPGNIRINPVTIVLPPLVKIGDPAVVIPSGNLSVVAPPPSLGSGEAADVSVTINIPDGIPVNAFYTGTITVVYEDCVDGENVSDSFTVELHVLPTQGTLDIVQTGVSGDFCPDDPWTMEGHVTLSFDVHANGDHRNIRVASGGLLHETMDKKLDLFNFYPEEIAFLAAGETRTITVITKIPIGQHSGTYADSFRVVSENGGEDAVHASIDICEIYDMDIKDDYANLEGNRMMISALSRANQSGGEWSLRAFDIGLPAHLVENHDEYDGPGNTPIDCIECEFAKWSPMWHEEDPAHNFYSNFLFTGEGTVIDDPNCDWGSGEFKRMLVSLFVPPIKKGENHPGNYRGRLDCYAIAGDDTVASDSFDIEIELARIVGPDYEKPEATFGGDPISLGTEVHWGDFRSVGISGPVNLYRQGPESGVYERVNTSPLPQSSSYVDTDVVPGEMYSYKLGVLRNGEEILIGPVSIGGNPRTFRLSQNAPNPFSSQTTIAFDMPEAGHVSLKVFDLSGRLVRTLRNDEEIAGFHQVVWNRRDNAGREAPNGIYFYRLDTPGFSATKKMLILR